MKKVEVEVVLLGNKIDWMTGKVKESKVVLVVDEDVKEVVRQMKIKDIVKISRDPKEHHKKPSYVLYSVGSTVMIAGETSIPAYLYGVKPGTRKVKGTEPHVFTRECFNLK